MTKNLYWDTHTLFAFIHSAHLSCPEYLKVVKGLWSREISRPSVWSVEISPQTSAAADITITKGQISAITFPRPQRLSYTHSAWQTRICDTWRVEEYKLLSLEGLFLPHPAWTGVCLSPLESTGTRTNESSRIADIVDKSHTGWLCPLQRLISSENVSSLHLHKTCFRQSVQCETSFQNFLKTSYLFRWCVLF